MDEPHRMIFTHINTAIEKINNNPQLSSDSVGLCFSTINAQLRDHFSREELIILKSSVDRYDSP